MTRTATLVGAALLGFLVLAALPAGAQEYGLQEEDTKTLEPVFGTYHPLPSQLQRGDALIYEWEVLGPGGGELYFSTHMHLPGGQLVNITEENASRLDGQLVADRDGPYSVLWENHGNESVTFRYAFRTVAASTLGEGNATPLGAWPVLAAPALAALLIARRRRSL